MDRIQEIKSTLALLEAEQNPDLLRVATLTHHLGMLHSQQQEYEAARDYLLKALPLLGSLRGHDHGETLLCLNNLGAIYERLEKLAEAEACYCQALVYCGEKITKQDSQVSMLQANLGLLLARRGNLVEAEPLLERASGFYRQKLGPRHAATCEIQRELGLVYFKQEKWAQAEPLLQALALVYGQTHPGTVETGALLLHAATASLALGRCALAESLYKRALAVHEEARGRTHAETLLCLEGLALLYAQEGRSAEHIVMLEQLLERSEENVELANPSPGERLLRLVEAYLAQGEFDRAYPLLERALEIYQRPGASCPVEQLTSFEDIASRYLQERRHEQARLLLERLLAIHERGSGWENPLLASLLNNLAGLALERDQPAEARTYLSRALTIREQELGSNHPALATLLNNLGSLNMKLDQWQEAEILLQRALLLCEDRLEDEPALSISLLEQLASIALIRQDEQHASNLLERSLALQRKTNGDESPVALASLISLALLAMNEDRQERVIELLERTLANAAFEQLEVRQRLLALDLLASAYQSQQQYKRASELLELALAWRECEFGTEHYITLHTLASLAALYLALGRTEQVKHACALAEQRGAWALDAATPEAAFALTLMAQLHILCEEYARATLLLERALTLSQNGEDTYESALSRLTFIQNLMEAE